MALGGGGLTRKRMLSLCGKVSCEKPRRRETTEEPPRAPRVGRAKSARAPAQCIRWARASGGGSAARTAREPAPLGSSGGVEAAAASCAED